MPVPVEENVEGCTADERRPARESMASPAFEGQTHVERCITIHSRVIPMVTYSTEVALLDFKPIRESLSREGKVVVLDPRAAVVGPHGLIRHLPYPWKAINHNRSPDTVDLEYSSLCDALAELGRKIVDKQGPELGQAILDMPEKQPSAPASRRFSSMHVCPRCGRSRLVFRALRAGRYRTS